MADRYPHRCHAIDCGKAIAPRLLMCSKHWRMVPRGLRTALWAVYQPGQEVDKDPSQAYLNAAQDAIDAVADKETPR